MKRYGCADILLSNPRELGLAPIRTKGLLDMGCSFLALPEHVAIQTKLEPIQVNSTREITMADGLHTTVPYDGPLSVCFGNRLCFMSELVMGDDPLQGLAPMAGMDLVVNAEERRLGVNPDSPNISSTKAE